MRTCSHQIDCGVPQHVLRSCVHICDYSSLPPPRQLEAPIRQYLALSDSDPVTQEHLAVALTAGLTASKARRTAERLNLPLSQHSGDRDADPPAAAVKETAAGWHGRMVVEAAQARGGVAELQSLMARFRAAFVHDLQPQHLPHAWSVHHQAARCFGPHSIYQGDDASGGGAPE